MIPPFELFYEAHRDEVYRFLGRRLGLERAEDAFQETFLRVFRHAQRFEGSGTFKSWVYAIAANACRTHNARRRTQDASLEDPEAEPANGSPSPPAADSPFCSPPQPTRKTNENKAITNNIPSLLRPMRWPPSPVNTFVEIVR